jgi:23S rRNA (cytidine1920-2'-O)/16S rRNA (cytidine1409-2'-O)-methyltransferase
MRADVLLVERGLAASRTIAQRMISGGHVFARAGASRVALAKPSVDLDDAIELEVVDNELDRYVSRGGLKLESALNRVAFGVRDLFCLDVGQSTGGFTDCLLQRGAKHVVGVDVGHDQLHAKLLGDSRVTCIEGLNARDLSFESLCGSALAREIVTQDEANPAQARACNLFDLIVADVSFISLTKVLPQWPALLAKDGRVLSLVKPQFEVGSENLGKGGIVRDASLYANVERSIRDTCTQAKLEVIDYFASSIEGGDGNREFFVYAKHGEPR